jgi:hypothetical protein
MTDQIHAAIANPPRGDRDNVVSYKRALTRNKTGELQRCHTYIYTYIPLTLDTRRGSRGVSDIPPRCTRFTKMT